MENLELTSEGRRILVNLALVAYFQPHADGMGTLVMFTTGLSVRVSESYDEAIALLTGRRHMH